MSSEIEKLLKHIRRDPNNWNQLADSFIALGRSAVKPLILLFDDENRLIREGAVAVVSAIGAVALDDLEGFSNNKSALVRSGVARVLGRIGNVSDVRILLNLLRDVDVTVRRSASEACIYIKDDQLREALIEKLQDADSAVRVFAVRALQNYSHPQVNESFYLLLNDESADVRIAILRIMSKIGNPPKDQIARLADDSNPNVRIAALNTLVDIDRTYALPYLFKGLKDGDSFEKRQIAYILGKLGDLRSIEALEETLFDNTEPAYLNEAIGALGKLDDPRSVNALKKLTGHQSDEVRVSVARALGNMQNAYAKECLAIMLKDSSESVRKVAAKSLEQGGS